MSSDTHPGAQLLLEWSSGGLANAITSALLNPMDVSKTRMQVTGNMVQNKAQVIILIPYFMKIYLCLYSDSKANFRTKSTITLFRRRNSRVMEARVKSQHDKGDTI